MSIRKMIALHPAAKGHVNQPLGDAVHHAMYCAKMCLSCADACLAEEMDLTQCIRACLDCADVCEATTRLGLRRTGSNEVVLREMLETVRTDCGRLRRGMRQPTTTRLQACAPRFAANAPTTAGSAIEPRSLSGLQALFFS